MESGLAFGVGFSYYTQRHVGPITIQGQTTPDKALALHRAILAEVEKLDMHVEEGKVLQFRAKIKLSFKYEEA